MQPYIISENDVIGANDIEGLLQRHPSVEEKNIKLWLTSVRMLEYVLSKIVNDADLKTTKYEIEQIKEKLPIFVEISAFEHAFSIIDSERIVVISGIPGIGKTTLAEALLVAHLDKDYQPVVIKESIKEGMKLFSPDEKQIFYFDDFLGQTYFGDFSAYMGENRDATLTNFIKMVLSTSNSRLILTTREHILGTARQKSEKISNNNYLEHRYVIELEDFTFSQKARILYNHLYFSRLPQTYKDAILEDHFFLKIINHKHFNPRLIEWLASYSRVRGEATETNYQQYILNLLNNPYKIWLHAFNNQISESSRHLLLVLYTVRSSSKRDQLETAFSEYRHYCRLHMNETIEITEFTESLKELEGGFISIGLENIMFLNPSIRDFMAALIVEEKNISIGLIAASSNFTQLSTLWRLAKNKPESQLNSIFKRNSTDLNSTVERLVLSSTEARQSAQSDFKYRMNEDTIFLHKIEFLLELAYHRQSTKLVKKTVAFANQILESRPAIYMTVDSIIGVLQKLAVDDWLIRHGGYDLYEALFEKLFEPLEISSVKELLSVENFRERALYWTEKEESLFIEAMTSYIDRDVYDEIVSCREYEEFWELHETLRLLEDACQLDLYDVLRNIDSQLANFPDLDEPNESVYERRIARADNSTVEDIVDMFYSLSANY